MYQLLILIIVCIQVFGSVESWTVRHKREASSSGNVDAEARQGERSNGTAELETLVDKHDNASVDAAAKVETMNMGGTSEIKNSLIGNITDKYGTKSGLEASVSTVAKGDMSRAESESRVNSSSNAVQSGGIRTSGEAQGHMRQSNVYQRFNLFLERNGVLNKASGRTESNAMGNLGSANKATAVVESKGTEADGTAETSAQSLDQRLAYASGEAIMNVNNRNSQSIGSVVTYQNGNVGQHSGAMALVNTEVVSNKTSNEERAKSHVSSDAVSVDSEAAGFSSENQVALGQKQGSAVLMGVSSGSDIQGSSSSGSASMQSTGTVDVNKDGIEAQSKLDGEVHGQNQSLDLLSNFEGNDQNGYTFMAGANKMHAKGNSTTSINSNIYSDYDSKGTRRISLGNQGSAGDTTGAGSEMNIKSTGVLQHLAGNVSNRVELTSYSGATGDSTNNTGDSYMDINNDKAALTVGATAFGTGLTGASSATNVTATVNNKTEVVGGQISVNRSQASTKSISRYTVFEEGTSRLNRHIARIFGASRGFALSVKSSSNQNDRRKRSAKSELTVVRNLCLKTKCYWLKEIEIGTSREKMFVPFTRQDLLRPFRIETSDAVLSTNKLSTNLYEFNGIVYTKSETE